MAADLESDPSVADLATMCNLSASHFARAFRASIGMPPHQWLIAQRVERACVMLRDPTAGLAEIADACGFVDQSHFTRLFAKAMGETPGRWRRIERNRR